MNCDTIPILEYQLNCSWFPFPGLLIQVEFASLVNGALCTYLSKRWGPAAPTQQLRWTGWCVFLSTEQPDKYTK